MGKTFSYRDHRLSPVSGCPRALEWWKKDGGSEGTWARRGHCKLQKGGQPLEMGWDQNTCEVERAWIREGFLRGCGKVWQRGSARKGGCYIRFGDASLVVLDLDVLNPAHCSLHRAGLRAVSVDGNREVEVLFWFGVTQGRWLTGSEREMWWKRRWRRRWGITSNYFKLLATAWWVVHQKTTGAARQGFFNTKLSVSRAERVMEDGCGSVAVWQCGSVVVGSSRECLACTSLFVIYYEGYFTQVFIISYDTF